MSKNRRSKRKYSKYRNNYYKEKISRNEILLIDYGNRNEMNIKGRKPSLIMSSDIHNDGSNYLFAVPLFRKIPDHISRMTGKETSLADSNNDNNNDDSILIRKCDCQGLTHDMYFQPMLMQPVRKVRVVRKIGRVTDIRLLRSIYKSSKDTINDNSEKEQVYLSEKRYKRLFDAFDNIIDINDIIDGYDINITNYSAFGRWEKSGDRVTVVFDRDFVLRNLPDKVFSFDYSDRNSILKVLIPVWNNTKQGTIESAVLVEEMRAPFKRYVISGVNDISKLKFCRDIIAIYEDSVKEDGYE